MKSAILSAVGSVIVGGLILAALALNFTINFSASAPEGLWWRCVDRELTPGTYVILYEPLKQIAAEPGQTIWVKPDGTYMEGRFIKHSAPVPGLPHYPFGRYVVPKGWLWLINPVDDSYDSRYCGFFPITMVKYTATPLWTKTNH